MNQANEYYGEVSNQDGQPVLRFERHFRHAPEKVWAALVEPNELAGWFPCRIEGERRLGATVRFVYEAEDAPPAEGKIVAFDPPRTLAYTWEQELLRWELFPTATGCRLIFTSMLDPQYPTVNTAAGWHLCFEMLEAQLDEKRVTWAAETRMEELRAAYDERITA